MKVIIKERQIIIGDNILDYYPNFFRNSRVADHRLTVKKVLMHWASALETLTDPNQIIYLPYFLRAQVCNFLKVNLIDDKDTLTFIDVKFSASGYQMNFDDLSEYIYSTPEIEEEFIDRFGQKHIFVPQYNWKSIKQEIIFALQNAEIETDSELR